MSEQPIINHTTIEAKSGHMIVIGFLFVFIVTAITVGQVVSSIRDSRIDMRTSCLAPQEDGN